MPSPTNLDLGLMFLTYTAAGAAAVLSWWLVRETPAEGLPASRPAARLVPHAARAFVGGRPTFARTKVG